MLSDLGITGISPYTADEEANTNFLTPAPRAATSRFNVPVTFTSWVSIGHSTERTTSWSAAR